MKVEFNTITQGTYSGYSAANELVINSTAEWLDLWQQHSSDNIPPPSAPEVDFKNYRIIAVFAGEKPTGGYSVEITSVKIVNFQLVITVRYDEPRAEDIVIQPLTYPHHIVVIPRMNVENAVFKRV